MESGGVTGLCKYPEYDMSPCDFELEPLAATAEYNSILRQFNTIESLQLENLKMNSSICFYKQGT